jgi:hypothetical protein
MNIPVTILTRTADGDEDVYGNPTEETVESDGVCWYHQGTSGGQSKGDRAEESGGLTELSTDWWTFYFPADTDVTARSAVTVPDGTFELVGEPWKAVHPRTGDVEYILASAERAG